MKAEDLLSRLEAVRSRGSGRWQARCPAHHPDRNPSLSVHEGDSAILIRCFAGCRTEEVVAAMGLTMKDLFYRTRQKADRVAMIRARHAKREALTQVRARGARIDSFRDAARVLRTMTGVNISEWADEQVDRALVRACNARTILACEEEPCQT